MKLLNVVHNSRVDTGGKISHDLLMKELEERGHQIEFLSTTHHDHFETHLMEDHMSVNLLEKRQKLVKDEVETQLEKKDYDYVYGNGYYAIPGMLKAAEDFDIETITHYRDYWFADVNGTFVGDDGKYYENCNLANIVKHNSLKRLPWNLYKWRYLQSIHSLLDSSDCKIATSKTVKRRLEECGLRNAKVVANPVNIEKYQKAEEQPDLSSEKFTVAFIGTLSRHKGTEVLKEIIHSLNGEDIEFLIVGDGPEKQGLKSELSQNVEFTGWMRREEIPSVYASIDFILYPSIYPEGFGRIAVESMAAGTPIIASSRGGVKDIIDDGKTGFLLDPNEGKKWAKKIGELKENKNIYEEISKNGKEEAEDYRVSSHVDKFLEVM